MEPRTPDPSARPSLRTIVGQWGRIGCTGFGGPPAHIALLRDLCVDRKQWITPREFEDAIAACNLLPGPASTQLAILSAWRVAGPAGAIVGGVAFIVPGLVLILGLATVFLASAPPTWVLGAGAGAGAAVAAIAVRAGTRARPPERAQGRGTLALGALRAARRDRGRHGRTVARPRAARLRHHRGPGRHLRAYRHARRTPLAAPCRDRDDCHRRGACLGVGGIQSRRPFLRRRLRDHPAHATRRRSPLSLDDQRAVPRRRRPRPSHAGAGHAHRRRCRLRRGRSRRRPARRARRLRAIIRVRAPRRIAFRPTPRQSSRPCASSTVPARPRSAPSSASPSPSRSPSSKPGNSRSSPPPPSPSFPSDDPSSSHSSARASSAQSRPNSEPHSHEHECLATTCRTCRPHRVSRVRVG